MSVTTPLISLPRQLGVSLLLLALVALKTRVAYFYGVARLDDEPLRYWAAVCACASVGLFVFVGSLLAE